MFDADGTDTRTVPTFDVNGRPADGEPLVGQWRWVADDHIEMDGFGERHPRVRVVVAGDELKLLFEGGTVKVYRRK